MKITSIQSRRKRIATAIALAPVVGAFVTPTGKLPTHTSTFSPTSLIASTLESPRIQSNSTSFVDESTSGKCPYTAVKDKLKSTLAAPKIETWNRESLDVRIHGTWYDLTGTCSLKSYRFGLESETAFTMTDSFRDVESRQMYSLKL